MNNKTVFISIWNDVLPHHYTQLASVVDAELLQLHNMRHGFLLSLSEKHKITNADNIIICTRMVSDPKSLLEALAIMHDIKKINKNAKVIWIENEGLAYYSFSGFCESFSDEQFGWFIECVRNADTIIVASENGKEKILAIKPDANVYIFGFIPEEALVYDYAINNPEFPKDNNIYVGIGDKTGVSRGGLIDMLIASSISREYDREVIPVLFTNGIHVPFYERYMKSMGLQTIELRSLDFPNYLRRLATLDIMLNLDVLDGASRIISECARVQVPCVGSNNCYYQNKYFKEFGVSPFSVEEGVKSALYILSEDSDQIKERCYRRARRDNRKKHIKEWKQIVFGGSDE